MGKHRGFLVITLLLALSSAAAVISGFLFYMTKSIGGTGAYGNGMRAAYAAESGVNWALENLKRGDIENGKISFTRSGAETEVSVEDVIKRENLWEGRILSKGTDINSKTVRYIAIDFSVTDGAEREVTVEDVRTDKWI